MKLLRQRTFLVVGLSHLAVDTLNSQVGILLAVLSTPLALTNTAIGLFATLYSIVGAVTQPLFGWIADRYGSRWSIAGGVLWMAAFFSLFAITPGYWPIACLIAGSLGSAAFHAPGAAKAIQVGHVHMAGQVATAASLFFLFGQGGFALGPAVGGFIIDHLNRPGILIITILAVPIGFFAIRMLDPARELAAGTHAADPPSGPAGPQRIDFGQFGLVLFVAAMGRWSELATATFTPKLLHDQGLSPTVYGAVLAAFMGASALGGVCGAMLGDRWGRLRTVGLASGLSSLPFFLLPAANGPAVFILAALCGLLNGAPFSILVTIAQKSLPGRGSLASGLTLGMMFAAGAVGSSISGWLADRIGLAPALQLNGMFVLAAVAGTLILAYYSRPLPIRVGSAAD